MKGSTTKQNCNVEVIYAMLPNCIITQCVSSATSVIKLAVHAFKDPFAYQLQQETKEIVATYESIIKGEQANTNFTVSLLKF